MESRVTENTRGRKRTRHDNSQSSVGRKKLKTDVSAASRHPMTLRRKVQTVVATEKTMKGKIQQVLRGHTEMKEGIQESSTSGQKRMRKGGQGKSTDKQKLVNTVSTGRTRLAKQTQHLSNVEQKLQKCVQKVSSSPRKAKENLKSIERRVDGMSRRQKETRPKFSEVKVKLSDARAAVGGRKSESIREDFTELQKTLRDLYSDSFSNVQVSALNDVKMPMDDIYTKVVIVQDNLDKQKEKEIPSYKHIFYKGKKRKQRRKNITVLGSAGTGKTTFCCQLAFLWAQIQSKKKSTNKPKPKISAREESLRQFEYLFLIQLCQLDWPTSIYDAICSTLLKEHTHMHGTVKDVLSQHPDKVLIICDGLDEYSGKTPPSSEYLHEYTVLTTTRPWKYWSNNTSSYKADIVLQIKGLDEEGIRDLTETMLVDFGEKEDSVKIKELLKDIESMGLGKIAQTPRMLPDLVHLWYNTESKLSQSITINMIRLIVCILQKEQENIKSNADLKRLQEKWSKEVLPGALLDEPELKPYGGLVLRVARISFEGLVSKTKEESLVFKHRTVDEYFSEPLELQACLKFGLLSNTGVLSGVQHSKTVSIYNKMVQEFLSALHAVCSEENYLELCKFCSSTDLIIDMENVYMFISGLKPDIGAQFSKHVAEVMSKDQSVADWRKKMIRGPCEDKVVRLMDLTANCLQEVAHSSCRTDQMFHITDICMDKTCLMYKENLLRNAIPTVKNICFLCVKLSKLEWELLLQVVSKSPSLQRLKLMYVHIDNQDQGNFPVYDIKADTSFCSALQFVKLYYVDHTPLLPILKRVNTTTNVAHKSNSSCVADSTFGQTSVNTGTLTYLQLYEVKLTRCEWDMVVNIASETTSLETLDLQYIKIEGGYSARVLNLDASNRSVKFYNVHAPLLPLLTHLRNRIVTVETDCGSIGGRTLGSTCTFTDMSLVGVTMTRGQWYMLMNMVSGSSSLKKLALCNIDIDDQDAGANFPVYEENTSTSTPSVLQYVELYNVPVPLLPLLVRVSSTNVTRQDSSGSDDECTSRLVSTTTGTLTELKVGTVTMTRCERDMLMNIISESPSLQKLQLGKINIDDLGGPNANASVALQKVTTNTSYHSVLQHVELSQVQSPLLQLLTVVRSTTVTQQDDHSSDGGLTSSAVSTGTLTYLRLWDVELTRSEWNMLENIVRKSPSLRTLMLWFISIDGENESIDCWRQMCGALKSSRSPTEVRVGIHETVANMEDWKTFTPDIWRCTRRPSFGHFVSITLEKVEKKARN